MLTSAQDMTILLTMLAYRNQIISKIIHVQYNDAHYHHSNPMYLIHVQSSANMLP